MGHHHSASIDVFSQRQNFFIKAMPEAKGGVLALIGAGVAALLVAVVLGLSPARIWSSLLLNCFFFFSIALGGIAFSGMQDVVGAVWGRPIKRIHESFSALLPVAGSFLIVFLLCIAFNVAGARSVYVWMIDPDMLHHFPGKDVWLQTIPFVVRNIFAIVVILLLSCWQLSLSTKRDKVFVDGNKEEAAKLAAAARDKLRYWCAPVLVCYAFCYSLLAFDLLMSLAPTWFSTLWAGWLFSIMMQTMLASLLISLFIFADTPLGKIYSQKQFHDVGKMMHGFSIFFGYLTYAHVLTYWYGNIPEETEYYIHRMHGPWLWIVLIAPLFSFVLPLFSLLMKHAKWTFGLAVPIASGILIAQWFAYCLIVLPQLGNSWTYPWLDLGLGLGWAGLFIGSVLHFGKKHPMLGVADDLLPAALNPAH